MTVSGHLLVTHRQSVSSQCTLVQSVVDLVLLEYCAAFFEESRWLHEGRKKGRKETLHAKETRNTSAAGMDVMLRSLKSLV
jgi:hypothetical protein